MRHFLYGLCMVPLVPLPVAMAVARTLFVSSYSGLISSLSFDNTTASLSLLSSNRDSAPAPSWIELSKDKRFLYAVEEMYVGDWFGGGVSSYSVGADGKLARVSNARGLGRPVSLAMNEDETVAFTACYDNKGVSAYSNNPKTGALKHLKSWTYELDRKMPVPDRQNMPHPHQVLFDPSKKFVLAPDLGADLIRIYRVDGSRAEELIELDPIDTRPGDGPRHGIFWGRWYYVINELSNSITVYEYGYKDGAKGKTVSLKSVQEVSTLPRGYPMPTRTGQPMSTPSAAEIIISPDGRNLYASNRNDVVFTDSHSLVAFDIEKETGMLSLAGHTASGVKTPRHISLDPTGRWLLAEGQDSGSIKVFERDERSGKLAATPTATVAIASPVCAQWLD